MLILAETKEYEKYAGKDLEEFYRSLGLEILHHPIADFSVPEQAGGWVFLDSKDSKPFCCVAFYFHIYTKHVVAFVSLHYVFNCTP